MDQYLFAVSIIAVRTSGTGKRFDVFKMDVMHRGDLLLTGSASEAERLGLADALERWPQADGYSSHSASAILVEKDFVREALRDMSEDPPEGIAITESEPPEQVM